MTNAALLAALALVAGLVWVERDPRPNRVLAFKAPASVLFVVVALLQPHPLPGYYGVVLAGLVLGLAGDVLLALRGDKAFLAGLVSFLLGHVAYVAAFAMISPGAGWFTLAQPVVLVVSGAVFWWLRPHVGADMRLPVLAYVAVISAMVMGAWAVFTNLMLPDKARWAILLGSVAFYVSDVFVARDRFVRPGWINRLLGLPLYYTGQFLLALSVGLVG